MFFNNFSITNRSKGIPNVKRLSQPFSPRNSAQIVHEQLELLLYACEFVGSANNANATERKQGPIEELFEKPPGVRWLDTALV